MTVSETSRLGALCDLAENAAGRIYETIAILDAIEKADLLAELPQTAEGAFRHQCAVSLLSVLRRDLEGLASELQSAGLVHEVIERLPRPASND